MALVLDEDQKMIQDSARDFCAARAPVAQLRALRDAADPLGYDADVWKEMVELGWAGITIPEEHGGTGFGWQALGVVLEENGRQLSASPLLATAMVGASAILLGGDEAQKAAWLPKVAAGETTLTLALEEGPHHAPYGAALEARRDGDEVVLSGRKVFVVDGHSADAIVVVARSTGAPGERAGLTLAIVDGEASGLTRRRTIMTDSRNAAILEFDGVRVPADRILGAEGAGADVLDPVLERARIGVAAEMVGIAEAAFERTLEYLKERKQFGTIIGSFQALKHRMADAYTELQLARSTVLDALTALDEDRDDVPMVAALAKATVGDALDLISREAIQMHGGIGMTDDVEIGFFLKRARVVEQLFGTRDALRGRYAGLAGY